MVTKPRVNKEIRSDKVRLIGAKGDQLGIVVTTDALRAAESEELDLVEVAPAAAPPVCRIMDYGKYKYEQTKKQHAAKLHQRGTQLKEVKFRPFTSQHDVEYKLRHVKEFLANGHKVKLTVMFRGREMTHQEAGHALLKRLQAILAEVSTPDQMPRSEGRNLLMIISPKAKTVAKKKPAAGKAKQTGTKAAGKTKSGAAAAAAVQETPPKATQGSS